ncbi:hypothetical protein D9M71_112350 [compost metagenome]
MAQAQLGNCAIHGFEPVVQPCAGADIDGGDLLRQLRNHQFAQPFVDGGEIVLFQQRGGVRLEQGVLEQQWHHVVKILDVLDAFGVRQFLEHRDTVAHLRETTF